MLIFLINPYCPKAYRRTDHSIRIVENHRKKLLLLSLNTSSPGLEPKTVFGIVVFVPVISPPKKTSLDLPPFFYLAKFPSYRNHLYRDLNAERTFVILAFVLVISSPEQTTLALAPFSYRAEFPSSAFTGTRTQDTFCGVVTFLKSLTGLKEYACQVWCKVACPFSSYKRTYMYTISILHIR
jgi:hypothetical protein